MRTIIDMVHVINDNVTTSIFSSEEDSDDDYDVSKCEYEQEKQYDEGKKDYSSVSHECLNDAKINNDEWEHSIIATATIANVQPQELEEK